MKHSIMIQIFNHRIDILPYPYASQIPCAMYVHANACVCVCACVDTSVYMYIHTSEFKFPRVCQDIPQELYT